MIEIFACRGGTVAVPAPGHALIDRRDGGHLIVSPARRVWERSELSARELAEWGALVAAVGRSMLDGLPQLEGGCINYWEASNWLLHDDAPPSGPKAVPAHRDVHLHVIGRSRRATHPAWLWGEAPLFPRFADRERWAADLSPLTHDECGVIRDHLQVHSARTKPCALVVFDLAGTTVRDNGAVTAAFERAVASAGLDVTASDVAAVRGLSKRVACDRLVPKGPGRDARVASIESKLRAEITAAIGGGAFDAMPGAEAVFRSLRSRDIRVGVTTGFDRETTSTLLRSLGWDHRIIDAVVCADDVRRGRPAPSMIFRVMDVVGVDDVRTVAAVGDTTADLIAGHNAGVAWNIGVLSGAHTREQLRMAPHTALIDSIAELNHFDVHR